MKNINSSSKIAYWLTGLGLLAIGIILFARLWAPESHDSRAQPMAIKKAMAGSGPQPTLRPEATTPMMREAPRARTVEENTEIETANSVVSAREPDWKKSDPLFHPFFKLHYLALRSAEAKAQYQELLSHPALIGRSQQILTHDLTPEKVDQRIYAVDFLSAALEYQENPWRQEILNNLETILTTPIPSAVKKNKKVYPAVLGDRLEVAMLLVTYDQPRIIRLLSTGGDSPNKKLIHQALEIMTSRAEERLAASAQ